MQALVKYAPGAGNMEVRPIPEPVPGPGQVLLQVAYAGICGSDMHIYAGAIEFKKYPLVPGHEISGTIAATGPGVKDWRVGERVTTEHTFSTCGRCLYCRRGEYQECAARQSLGFDINGGFAEYVLAASDMLHRLPENLPLEAAALSEPLASAVHAVSKAGISWGDNVLVIGPGTIGQLAAQVAKAEGGRVFVIGTEADAERLQVAKSLGADYTFALGEKAEEGVKDTLLALTAGYGPDIVLECSGSRSGAALGLEIIRRQGTYIQVGLFGRPVELDYEQISYKELIVNGIFCHNWPDWEKALALMAAGRIGYRQLITTSLPLAEWQEGFQMMAEHKGLKILLAPGEGEHSL
ncbi:zinc-binding dehydrogenase [Moorella naiadis]|uniref:zinc-dependent alcohol dehydrogenase n=1 Tax=Moorella naiadis (nom. illeg.) TaxID=3093670 RepID=UPI003D9C8C96